LLFAYSGYILLIIYNERIHDYVHSRFLVNSEIDPGKADASQPLQSFRIGLLKLLGNIGGKASYTDFLGTYMVNNLGGTVEKTFRAMDVDKDGLLNNEDLRISLLSLGVNREMLKRDIKSVIKAADLNGDGVISLDEFKT